MSGGAPVTTTLYVRPLLQTRIVSALQGSAVTAGLNVYKASAYDRNDTVAPNKIPAALVMMPEETSSDVLTPDGLVAGDFSTDILLFGASADGETGDADMAALCNRVQVALATWMPPGDACQIGVGKNSFTAGEAGWVVVGHEHCFRLSVSCRCYYSLAALMTMTETTPED